MVQLSTPQTTPLLALVLVTNELFANDFRHNINALLGSVSPMYTLALDYFANYGCNEPIRYRVVSSKFINNRIFGQTSLVSRGESAGAAVSIDVGRYVFVVM
jgi:hypothetical protein